MVAYEGTYKVPYDAAGRYAIAPNEAMPRMDMYHPMAPDPRFMGQR